MLELIRDHEHRPVQYLRYIFRKGDRSGENLLSVEAARLRQRQPALHQGRDLGSVGRRLRHDLHGASHLDSEVRLAWRARPSIVARTM